MAGTKEAFQIRNPSNAIASDSESETKSSEDDDDVTWKRCRRTVNKISDVSASHPSAFLESASNFTQNRKSLSDNVERRKLNVWSNVIEQRSLAENLTKIVDVNKNGEFRGYDRGSESYEYPGCDRPRAQIPLWKMDSQKIHQRLGRKRSRKDRGKKQLSILSKDKRPFQVTAENTEEEIVKAIATILREPKEDLIERTVSVLGKDKALELLSMTEDIEEENGMMTADQSRRRTPGGVFLLLVRNDRDVTREQLDRIFEDERRQQASTKKEMAKAKRRLKTQEQLQDMKLFPTREELMMEEGAVQSKEFAEQMETTSKNITELENEKEPGELTDSENELE